MLAVRGSRDGTVCSRSTVRRRLGMWGMSGEERYLGVMSQRCKQCMQEHTSHGMDLPYAGQHKNDTYGPFLTKVCQIRALG